MITGILLLCLAVSLLLVGAIAWTIKLANQIPAMHDMMPILPGEQFFIVYPRRTPTE